MLVGLTTPPVAKLLPSQIYRFGTSQAWCHRSTVLLSRSAPMRQVPSRCQAGGAVDAVLEVVGHRHVERIDAAGEVAQAVDAVAHHAQIVLVRQVVQLRGRQAVAVMVGVRQG